MSELELANFISPKKCRAVIAGMLCDKLAIEIARELSKKHFTHGSDYSLFSSIQAIYDKAKVIPTADDILEHLEWIHKDDEAGDRKFRADKRVLDSILAEKKNLTPEIVRENTKDIVLEIKQDYECYALLQARTEGIPTRQVYDKFRHNMDLLVRDPSKKLVDVSEEMGEALERASKFIDGITFGIQELDDQENISLSPGTLTVLLAASNIGKSWFCSHIFCHAMRNKSGVLYITLEMSKDAAMQRVASTISAESPKMDHKKLAEKYEKKRKVAMNGFAKCAVDEYSPNSAMSSDIRASIEAYKSSFDRVPELVIVDGISDMYLSADKAYGELGQIAGDFCGFAKEYGCAFLTTAQANRTGYGDKAETLSAGHMGDSIKIFQRADTVLSLAPKVGSNNEVILFIAKARHGQRGRSFEITQNLGTGQFCVGTGTLREQNQSEPSQAREETQKRLRGAHSDPDKLLGNTKQFQRHLDEEEEEEEYVGNPSRVARTSK